MNILHLISQRPDSTGSGIYVQAMIRESAACGYDNFLVAGIPSDVSVEIDGLTAERGMFVRFQGGRGDLPYPIAGMSDAMPYASTKFCDLSPQQLGAYERAFSETLDRAVNGFAPDLIHSHHLWIVSSLARQRFPDIPMVTSCHGSDLRQFQNCPHLRRWVLAGCRKTDAILALSASQKNDILELYGVDAQKVAVVGAGYDDRLFFPHPKPAPEPVQLVYAGKLSRAKGVPWMLRALAAVDFPAWKLHLLGDGSGEEKALCLMLARQLGNRVAVHGALPQEKLADIMRQAHILVLPSFFEGLPLVVLEGLASGCRIVATDLPGVKAILDPAAADFISLVRIPRLRQMDQPHRADEKPFEKDLAKALQTQIEEAFASPDIDLSAVREHISSFSWPGIFQRVRSVYGRVCSAGGLP